MLRFWRRYGGGSVMTPTKDIVVPAAMIEELSVRCAEFLAHYLRQLALSRGDQLMVSPEFRKATIELLECGGVLARHFNEGSR
jgi:hypothetical protein